MKNESSALQFSINPGIVYITTNNQQSSYANITVTVVNTGTEPVSVNTIAITLPPELAPAATLNTIIPGSILEGIWSFAPSEINTGEFDAIGQNTDNVTINPGGSYVFSLQMVTLVNSIKKSSANVTVVVTFADGSAGEPVLLNVDISNAGPAIISFDSNISNIPPNGSAELSWQCTGDITNCIISPLGISFAGGSNSTNVAPVSSTMYTLYAYAPGVILSAQWNITVDNVKVSLFSGVNGQTKLNWGDNISLVWQCNQYASKVTLQADTNVKIPSLLTGTNTAQNGTVSVGPINQQTIFTFTAFGVNPQDYVQVDSPPISVNDVSVTLTANPATSLWAGDKVTFNWEIVSASAVSFSPAIKNGPSMQNLIGSADFYPDTDITSQICVLTATGYVNNDPVTITNEPPLTLEFQPVLINSFTIWPPAITPDNSPSNEATLQWLSQSQVVSIDNGIGQETTQGISVIQTPVNGTVYTLTAGTNQNPVQQTAQVTVVNAFGPYTFNSFNTNPLFAYITNFVIPDPGPMSALMSMGGYTVILTGVVPTGAPAPYVVLNYYNENDINQSYFALMTWPITTDPPYPTFEWADPDNQLGTITLVASLNGGGGGNNDLEEFIKQQLS